MNFLPTRKVAGGPNTPIAGHQRTCRVASRRMQQSERLLFDHILLDFPVEVMRIGNSAAIGGIVGLRNLCARPPLKGWLGRAYAQSAWGQERSRSSDAPTNTEPGELGIPERTLAALLRATIAAPGGASCRRRFVFLRALDGMGDLQPRPFVVASTAILA